MRYGKREPRAHAQQVIDRDQAVDRARIAPQRCRRRVIDRGQPAFLDQAADHGAGDRLGHRPARGRTIGGAEFAVTFAQDALGTGDQDPIGPGRASKEGIERASDVSGRGRRCLDCIANRPGAPGLLPAAGDRLRIEAQARVRAQDDAAIAGPRDRGADNRLAETGVVPADDSAAIGIVHFDDNVTTALGGGELRLAVGRGTELEPARRHHRAPTKMPVGGGAVEPADIAHVDEALGGKIHRALTQRPRRGVVDQRIR
jgi:hypothetical protein